MSDWLTRLAARASLAIVGWRAGVAVSHVEWIARARAWTALARRTPGRDIALFTDDSLEFAAALLGAWQAGKTVWLAADALPATCDALAHTVDAFWGQYPDHCAPQAPTLEDRCDQAWQDVPADFPALVIHTSGSTGAPKAIAKRMSQISSELLALENQFGARVDGAEVLATVSHQHIYGLLFRVLWPLAAGRAIHAHGCDHPETLALALAGRPCILVASPAHLKRLPDHLDWAGAQGQLRAVFSSGGALPPEAALHVCALLGMSPIEVYGSSETGGIAWRQVGAGGIGDAQAWRPLPLVQWRVCEGLLEVCSPHAAADNWLQLADLALDAGNGSFVLQGRSDRIVKIEEKRVSLETIEAALIASGLVFDARVIACPTLANGRQSLAAFVVPTPEGRATLDAEGKAAFNKRLRALLAASVEAVVLPRRWRYLDQLPMNAQGKISQARLLELLDEASAARPLLPTTHLLETSPDGVLLELTVPAELLYFDGHFDVAPVLPGVVQVDWAILFGRRHFAMPPAFCGMLALKFQQMIRPGGGLQLELRYVAAKACLHFRYFSEAGPHASGRILFGPAVNPSTDVKDVC